MYILFLLSAPVKQPRTTLMQSELAFIVLSCCTTEEVQQALDLLERIRTLATTERGRFS